MARREDTIRSQYRSFKFYLSIGYTETAAFDKAFDFPLIDAIGVQHRSIESAVKQNIETRKGPKL